MILLWFVIGIAIIFCIARYNESNKLFWQLLIAFILGFSITKMVLQVKNENQSNETLTQVCPTQVSTATIWTIAAYNAYVEKVNAVTVQPLVSKDCMPVLNESDITLNKICGRVRDQPQKILTNPPELCLLKSFSTHHETR